MRPAPGARACRKEFIRRPQPVELDRGDRVTTADANLMAAEAQTRSSAGVGISSASIWSPRSRVAAAAAGWPPTAPERSATDLRPNSKQQIYLRTDLARNEPCRDCYWTRKSNCWISDYPLSLAICAFVASREHPQQDRLQVVFPAHPGNMPIAAACLVLQPRTGRTAAGLP